MPKKTLIQLIQFCVIGVSNTIIQLGIYYLLIRCNVYYLAANIIAFFLSVANSYIWNKKFTFKEQGTTKITIVKMYASYGVTTLLSTGLLYVLVDILGISKYISPIINIIIITGINFVLTKYLVFRRFK
jgi:putative flippase GtrA